MALGYRFEAVQVPNMHRARTRKQRLVAGLVFSTLALVAVVVLVSEGPHENIQHVLEARQLFGHTTMLELTSLRQNGSCFSDPDAVTENGPGEVRRCLAQVCGASPFQADGTWPMQSHLLDTCCGKKVGPKLISANNRSKVFQIKPCAANFGCFANEETVTAKVPTVEEKVEACHRFLCSEKIKKRDDWAKAQKTPRFADANQRGQAECCLHIIEPYDDSSTDFCAKYDGSQAVMDADACKKYMCTQDPQIMDTGSSLLVWQQAHSGDDADAHVRKSVDQCAETLRLSGDSDWTSVCVEPEPIEQEGLEANKLMEDLVGKRLTPDDLKRIEAQENPNANPLVPVDLAGNDCSSGASALPLLAGTDVLGMGYDPALKPGCEFDMCITRDIFKWSFANCKAIHTPGGTFGLPDQVRTFNMYTTKASTKVFMSEKDESKDLAIEAGVSGQGNGFTGAASFGYGQSGQSSKSEHKAVRKVDVNLYSLRAMPPTHEGGLSDDFVASIKALPDRFYSAPHRYLEFIRTWGRFVAVSGYFGGSLEIDLEFKSSSSAKKTDIAVGVEAAYDGMFSTKAHFGLDMSKTAKSLMGSSEISLKASGGDPKVAATITDLAPGTENTAKFRDDFVFWLESLPKFPRLVNSVPKLVNLDEILPVDGSQFWEMRRAALRYTIQMFSADPSAAMNAKNFQCSPNHGQVSYHWRDFNRLERGHCLAFAAKTRGDLFLALAGSPSDPSSWYTLSITRKLVAFVKGGTDILASTANPSAFAVGSDHLVGDYWVCLQNPEDLDTPGGGDAGGLILEYGKGSTKMLTAQDPNPLSPTFFSFGCNTHASISAITIFKTTQWQLWTTEATGCIIQNCDTLASSSNGEGCRCAACKSGFVLAQEGRMCSSNGYCKPQLGCSKMVGCECRECCCGLALNFWSKSCVENGVWFTDKDEALFTNSIGTVDQSKAHTLDSFELVPEEGKYYRMEELTLTCERRLGVQSILVKYAATTLTPPRWTAGSDVEFGTLVGDTSSETNNLVVMKLLMNKPKIKQAAGFLKRLFPKSSRTFRKLKKSLPFTKKITFAKLGKVMKSGMKALGSGDTKSLLASLGQSGAKMKGVVNFLKKPGVSKGLKIAANFIPIPGVSSLVSGALGAVDMVPTRNIRALANAASHATSAQLDPEALVAAGGAAPGKTVDVGGSRRRLLSAASRRLLGRRKFKLFKKVKKDARALVGAVKQGKLGKHLATKAVGVVGKLGPVGRLTAKLVKKATGIGAKAGKALLELAQEFLTFDPSLIGVDLNVTQHDWQNMMLENFGEGEKLLPVSYHFQCHDGPKGYVQDMSVGYEVTTPFHTLTSEAFISTHAYGREAPANLTHNVFLGPNEAVTGVLVAANVAGLEGILELKTNKRRIPLTCGKSESKRSEGTWTHCPDGMAMVGWFASTGNVLYRSHKMVKAIAPQCMIPKGYLEQYVPPDPYFYDDLDDTYNSWSRFGSLSLAPHDGWNLASKSGASASDFDLHSRSRIRSLSFYCAKNAYPEGITVGYTDGEEEWDEDLGTIKDKDSRTPVVVTIDDNEKIKGITGERGGNHVVYLHQVFTNKRKISIKCGDAANVKKSKRKSGALWWKKTKTSYSASMTMGSISCTAPSSFVIGFWGQTEKKSGDSETNDLYRLRSLGVVCARKWSSRKTRLTYSKTIKLGRGEYLVGLEGRAVINTATMTTRLTSLTRIATNMREHPLSCGPRDGEKFVVGAPGDGMAIGLRGEYGAGFISGLGLVYAKVPNKATAGFILRQYSSVKETERVGKETTKIVDMKKAVLKANLFRYLRLVEIKVQCRTYEGGSEVSFMQFSFSNRDKSSIGMERNERILSVATQRVDLTPTETVSSIEFWLKDGVISGVDKIVTSRSSHLMFCGTGSSKVKVEPPAKHNIVGIIGYSAASKGPAIVQNMQPVHPQVLVGAKGVAVLSAEEME